MRILLMADTPPDPDRGAAGTEVQTMLALRRLGHTVDARWAADLGRRIEHGNLHLLLELPCAYEKNAMAALALHHYDVVHVNQPHGYRAARAVHRHAPTTAFIHRSHGFELSVDAALLPWRARYGAEVRSRMRRLASRAITPLLARHSLAIAREADGHVVSSSIDARFLEEQLGVAREGIAVVAQAPPDSFVDSEAPPMTTARRTCVLYVGQFAFVKAPMITASAIDRMAAADADLRFTWVCDRSSEADVRALMTPDSNARLDVLPWTTQDALRDIYDAHGIFLFPSFFEGFGKAFLEAMSRGLCVIASDVGGMHDVITSGHDGILVPPGDEAALADAAMSVIRDPATARAISAAAAATARQYSWERVARETADFYRARLNAMRR